ncbi:MAG: hypothetical protein A3C44_02075 [Gammaproteobacteria bacterium RIFCSPHIGHO2_02_FULL_39_13]|nr:MAG: hypothetical protein A3C44_02075 [Gammaproteobacteria bacterium RIFCSPHIGHO2_02_FULL_39_13]OGT48324.1 MAG: hypothetical protein A3E53_05770 [Gammaproteobacteria bacterium RIFCSPHIGHO2_12_FULL_39_24]
MIVLSRSHEQYRYLTLLSMLYGAILQISVLLDYKFISIDSMVASSATFVISITFFLADVIAEVYGYQKAKQVVWSGLIGLLCFSTIGFVLQKLPTPPEFSQYTNAYHIILNLLFRAGISNAIAIMIGAFFNIYFVSRWKIVLRGKYFWLRSLGSSAIGEALYTIFVVSLVNVGVVPFPHFLQILGMSYSYKLLFDTVAIMPANLLAQFLKKRESLSDCRFAQDVMPFKNERVFE